MEQMRKRLMPLATNGSMLRAPDMMMDSVSASYRVTDGGTLNLMGQSCGEYNINEMGLERKKGSMDDTAEGGISRDVSYRCASHEMLVFNTIGWGASSTVRKAIHIPHHRIVALKKINSADRDKRQQLLKEIKTLCEAQHASANNGLVEFYGAFYAPDSGQVSIALEYMDGGSLADIVRVVKKIPEPILSKITQKVLAGLSFLHQVRHLVHRDIKPANLLINLNGEPKITDFGISAGLDNSVAMCATFVGTVTYMSPERINNEPYSFPADIWSLGLTLLECGTGIFPYNATTGPVNLMLQVMYDPSPSPPPDQFSPEFCDFVDACLRKDADSRPTAEQLLAHPFITKYQMDDRQLAEYVNSVFDPAQRLKDLSDMLTTHYYSLFDGSEAMFGFLKHLYRDESALVVGGEPFTGQQTIYDAHCELQRLLNKPDEKWVHVINSLECCGYGDRGVMIRVTGNVAVGSQFTPANGTAGTADSGPGGPPPLEIRTGPVRGSFSELFVFEPSKEVLGSFWISRQETHLQL